MKIGALRDPHGRGLCRADAPVLDAAYATLMEHDYKASSY